MLGIVVCFLLIIVEPILSRYISFFSYSDELITIGFFLFAFGKNLLGYKKVNVRSFYLLIPLTLFLLIGIIGNIRYGYQPQMIAIVKDIFAVLKFFVLFFSITSCEFKYDEKVVNITSYIIKSYTIVLVLSLAALHILNMDIFTSGEIRHGFVVYQFLYSHPTFLVASSVAMTGFLYAYGKKYDWIYIVLLQLVNISSLRSKGILIAGVVLLFYIFKVIDQSFSNTSRKIVLSSSFVVGLLVALILSWPKINETLQYGMTAARPALYIVGFKIAGSSFPFGAGFGSFASSLSGEYYSKIYELYEMNTINGLTPDKYNYMADTYWPYLLGQFGYLGTFIYVGVLFYIFFYVYKRCEDGKKRICLFYIVAYILIATMVETVLTNTSCILYSLLLGMLTISTTSLEQKEDAECEPKEISQYEE